MVNADACREHARRLVDGGMRQCDIAKAAGIFPAALQILLHGHYTPSRTKQRTIHKRTADRILAVRLVPNKPARHPAAGLCAPGERYTPVGYRVGRCDECGQLAPTHRLYSRVTLIAHPEPEPVDNEGEAA